ncbi:ankyrin repeat-containing domain protein [Xylariaceae sp. FL0662B]|nr:ankyrin repeat-containing domain protein [Xylariaceae sp. FL0662B]
MEAQLKAQLGEEIFQACVENQRHTVENWVKKLPGSDTMTVLPSPMAAAAPHDAADVIAFCIELGAVVTDPIMVAIASNGSFASYRVLIDAKAVDIDYFIPWHGDILGLAATSNCLDWARFCLERGANPNLNLVDGYKTILAATAENDHREMVELLLQHGAWLQGSGAIVLAAEAGQTEIVRFLLTRGAALDEIGVEDPEDEESKTELGSALHKAVSRGNVETALFLVDSGASLELEDAQGKTALALAEESYQTEILEQLINAVCQGLSRVAFRPAYATGSMTLGKSPKKAPVKMTAEKLAGLDTPSEN